MRSDTHEILKTSKHQVKAGGTYTTEVMAIMWHSKLRRFLENVTERKSLLNFSSPSKTFNWDKEKRKWSWQYFLSHINHYNEYAFILTCFVWEPWSVNASNYFTVIQWHSQDGTVTGLWDWFTWDSHEDNDLTTS